jgi:hypothetical protein
MKRSKPKRRRAIAAVLLGPILAYLGSYAVLSSKGHWVYSQTGKVRYDFGFAMSDVIRWDPAAAHWEPFHDIHGSDTSRGIPTGYFYSPLIRLDRATFHRDRPVTGEAG